MILEEPLMGNVEGAEHIELALEDLFVDDVDVAVVDTAPATRSAARRWAIAGLLLGLGGVGVAALLLRPPRWNHRFRFHH